MFLLKATSFFSLSLLPRSFSTRRVFFSMSYRHWDKNIPGFSPLKGSRMKRTQFFLKQGARAGKQLKTVWAGLLIAWEFLLYYAAVLPKKTARCHKGGAAGQNRLLGVEGCSCPSEQRGTAVVSCEFVQVVARASHTTPGYWHCCYVAVTHTDQVFTMLEKTSRMK